MNEQDKKNNFFTTMPVKPVETIRKIISFFAEASRPLLGRYGDDRINLNDPEAGLIVIFLLEGRIDVLRNQDQLLVATAVAPAILGIQGSEFRYSTHTFRRQPCSDVYFLPYERAIEIIKEKDIFQEVINYQAYMNDQQTYRDFLLIHSSVYEVVCMLLTELSQYPDCHEMSVEKYILSRTRMARSGVMKILADLRYGGFIEMKKGKLIRLGNPFPQNY